MALPFPIRILICAGKSAPALWGTIWALNELLGELSPLAKGTASDGTIQSLADLGRAAIMVALNHPAEIAWGHILVGFFWALFTEKPRAKLQRMASKARLGLRNRRPQK